MKTNELTLKEERFVAEYLIDGNATRAAITSGYSQASATTIAHRLLRKDHIKRAIDRSRHRALLKADVTLETITAELAKIAFSNVGAYLDYSSGRPVIDISKCEGAELAAIQEITVDMISEEMLQPDSVLHEGCATTVSRKETKTKLKFHDKHAALNTLARMNGGFKDDILKLSGVAGAPPIPVTIDAAATVKAAAEVYMNALAAKPTT